MSGRGHGVGRGGARVRPAWVHLAGGVGCGGRCGGRGVAWVPSEMGQPRGVAHVSAERVVASEWVMRSVLGGPGRARVEGAGGGAGRARVR